MGVNKTHYKSLDKLARDPRIDEIWDEGEDGIWASLKPGYNAEGCSCLHEWSCKDLLDSTWRIAEGPTY